MRKILPLLLLLLSCERPQIIPDNEKIYYKFSQGDYENIPDRYRNTSIIYNFKSETGDTVELKSKFYNLDENRYSHGEYFGKEYYYDFISIRLQFSNSSTDCPHMDIGISKSEEGKVGYYFTTMGITASGFCTGVNDQFILPDKKDFTAMTINKTVYNKVFVIDLENRTGLADIYCNSNFRLNKIYFDLKYGVIGIKNSLNQHTYWIQN